MPALADSSEFTSEAVIVYELGYCAELGQKFTRFDFAYYNKYSDIRSTANAPITPLYPFPHPVVFQNGLEGDTYGLEVDANYQLLDWWQMHAGYNMILEDIHADPGYIDATGALNETAGVFGKVEWRY